VQQPFRCELIAATEQPQRAIYLALHNDYSEGFNATTNLSEDRCGEIAVKRLLEGGKGHFEALEHPQLQLLLQVDHNTAMQLRTHRVGLSFDCQSMRYTGERMIKCAAGEIPLTEVYYIRPPGRYHDRQGDPYNWGEKECALTAEMAMQSVKNYARLRELGASEEHARGVLGTGYYQNCMISGNLRAWLHLLDVRYKADAQLEIRLAMELVAEQLKRWVPEVWAWYATNRLSKARLAP
jgi:thymidylate synthase (FAD)